MNKLIPLILSILLSISLTSCAGNETQLPDAAPPLTSSAISSSAPLTSSPKPESTPAPSTSTEENGLSASSIEVEPEESMEPDHAAVAVQYAVGDIIFTDGSVTKADNLTALDNRNLPVAVVAGFNEDGTALGVGVHRSHSPLQWAADDTTGYATKFADIVCVQQGAAETFTGDLDGSDNWETICLNDGQGVADAAKNYPAFDFVYTYAQANNLQGVYASGWYLPSIAELCMIYENRAAVNASLEKICALDSAAAMNGMDTNWYWSSSQAASQDDYAWFVHFFNGYAGECPKNFTNVDVLAVRAF